MAKEEMIAQLGMIEQEMNRLEQQMQIVEQQITELQTIQSGLQDLEKSKEREMLAGLGKGIFIKTEILDKNLFVDVGSKTLVRKSIAETLKIIEEQLNRLAYARERIAGNMQEIQKQMESLLKEAEAEEKVKQH